MSTSTKLVHLVRASLQQYKQQATIQVETCPLAWWAERQALFPHLSLLARDILGSPGSTAAIERCSSNAGRVWTERRTNLDPRVGSDILLCHENINRGSFGDRNGHLCLLDFPRGLSGAASTLVACLLPAKGEHACWAPKRASRASFGQNVHQRPASSLPERVPHEPSFEPSSPRNSFDHRLFSSASVDLDTTSTRRPRPRPSYSTSSRLSSSLWLRRFRPTRRHQGPRARLRPRPRYSTT